MLRISVALVYIASHLLRE